jgi:hypothetical protein
MGKAYPGGTVAVVLEFRGAFPKSIARVVNRWRLRGRCSVTWFRPDGINGPWLGMARTANTPHAQRGSDQTGPATAPATQEPPGPLPRSHNTSLVNHD